MAEKKVLHKKGKHFEMPPLHIKAKVKKAPKERRRWGERQPATKTFAFTGYGRVFRDE